MTLDAVKEILGPPSHYDDLVGGGAGPELYIWNDGRQSIWITFRVNQLTGAEEAYRKDFYPKTAWGYLRDLFDPNADKF